MMEAGQLDLADQIVRGDEVWYVAEVPYFGPITIGRDDGGCIRLDTIGRHEEVDRALDLLDDLNRQVRLAEIQWRSARKYRMFAAHATEALEKLRSLRERRDRLVGQVRP